MPAPLTDRELLIARVIFRHTLDAFNGMLAAGFPREHVFQALYTSTNEELDVRLTQKLEPLLAAEEKIHAEP